MFLVLGRAQNFLTNTPFSTNQPVLFKFFQLSYSLNRSSSILKDPTIVTLPIYTTYFNSIPSLLFHFLIFRYGPFQIDIYTHSANSMAHEMIHFALSLEGVIY